MKTNVVSFHKPSPVEDPIFFVKEQLRIGTVLSHFGRLDPGTQWRITRIQSFYPTGRIGHYRLKDVESVRHLSDLITLNRLAGGGTVFTEQRQGSFAYLSYSAIWRLPNLAPR